MELPIAIALVSLAFAGLAAGLLLGRAPPQTACEGAKCLGLSCATCPNRAAREARHGRG
ncbi:hypothetical protein [Maliponia aquimaris]|uniref:Uncharacterized protein n=1 Tax=Maliponia aquimaris TaxID=1673631 RepID=A0A238KI25_9RHOB|nr:hypothetical protein [Maliponia aquimaris]SMX42390.1 hypothetical protein MAA8898_02593 [Maliponia aquimaris]